MLKNTIGAFGETAVAHFTYGIYLTHMRIIDKTAEVFEGRYVDSKRTK